MAGTWRELVAELAGPEAVLHERVAPELDGMFVAGLEMPGALFNTPGETADAAWRTLAHRLGDLRLVESLERSRWVVIEEVIDHLSRALTVDRPR